MSWNCQATPGSDQRVQVAVGLVAPPTVEVRATDEHGTSVTLGVEFTAAGSDGPGRMTCTSVTVEAASITSEVLRTVPVAHLTKHAASWVRRQTGHRALSNDLRRRLRAAGPTTETLEWVAYAYRLAVLTGEPPTKSVERVFEVPRSTAGRWVALARAQELLGAAEGPGKAGG